MTRRRPDPYRFADWHRACPPGWYRVTVAGMAQHESDPHRAAGAYWFGVVRFGSGACRVELSDGTPIDPTALEPQPENLP